MSGNNPGSNNIIRGMMNQQQQQQQYMLRNQTMHNMQIHQHQQQATPVRQFNPELFNNIYNQQYQPNMHPQQQQRHLGMQPFGLLPHQLHPPGHRHQQQTNMPMYPQHHQQNMLVQHILPPQQQQFSRNPMQHLQWYPQMLQVMDQQHMQPSLLPPPMNVRHPPYHFAQSNDLINNMNQQAGLVQSTSTPNSQIFSMVPGAQNGSNSISNNATRACADNQHGANPTDQSRNTSVVQPIDSKETGNVIQETMKNISEEGLKPGVPYYELPAGLMVPLIGLADREYKPINPDQLRLPPPTVPSEKLLKAVEEFYRPQSSALKVDGRPTRDNDGWNRQFIDDYIKKKGQAMVEAMLAK